jgi:glucose-1-phosphate adenylyltransferase
VSVERVVFNGHPEMAHIHGNDVPDVGAGSVVYGCVVQSDVLIGAGCVLTNEKRVKSAEVIDDEGHGYIIDDGIITILEGTVLAAGTVI